MPLPLLTLLAVGCDKATEDHAFVLGVGQVVDGLAAELGQDLLAGGDLVGDAHAPEPPSGAWTGRVDAHLANGGTLSGNCGEEPCTNRWTATLALDDVFVVNGGAALAAEGGFDCLDGDDERAHCQSDTGFDLDPPDFTINGSLELLLGATVGDTDYGEVTWHIETTAPGALHASALWIDRTADVTLTYDAWKDDYYGDVAVAGTVDGAASGYDYGWWNE